METPEFIPPTLWPPNSPDLNAVDYKVCSVMQEKVYKKRIKDIGELRARILIPDSLGRNRSAHY